MPISPDFAARLDAVLPAAVEHFGTPFHIYDERGIVETSRRFCAAFADMSFREFFAVKALPNPAVLRILAGCGLGFDCSSAAELELAGMAGAVGHDVFFTSNNTSRAELAAATARGALVNVDDLIVLEKFEQVPETLSFRLNPGPVRLGDQFLGAPTEAKFGVRTDQLVAAYSRARDLGATTFGIHTMIASNELRQEPLLLTLRMLLGEVLRLRRALGIELRFVNLGGGIGIPYRPDERPFDVEGLGRAVRAALDGWREQHRLPVPEVYFECGRYITGPHGVLVTRVVNRMSKWREYVGVDASMSALMRPALYPSAYHHITVARPATSQTEVVDVVGSLCENNDKFGVLRELPRVDEGDVLLVHDTGAHGQSMGFTYNGRLRPKELLLRADGTVELIRRAEEIERDYFATLSFPPDWLPPAPTRPGLAAASPTPVVLDATGQVGHTGVSITRTGAR